MSLLRGVAALSTVVATMAWFFYLTGGFDSSFAAIAAPATTVAVLAFIAERRLGSRHIIASSTPVSTEMVAVITAISEEEHLQQWFRELLAMPTDLRASAISKVVLQMKAAGEDAAWVAAFGMLADPEVCLAIGRILTERFGIRR